LWRDAQGATGTTNLTDNAQAPKAAGNPFAYVDTARNTVILLYRSGDGVVRSLYWSTGAVGADNLSGTAGAPKTAGDPVGYYTATADTHHVIYRTGDGHLHELNWAGVAPVSYGGNLTAAIAAPKAAGQPSAFVNAAGVNIVAYRATNNHILSLYWADGPSGLDDLSGFAGTPPAAGDPVGYYTAHDDTHHVIYRTSDGRLHEIWSTPGGGTPQHTDLTDFAAAPPAADRPAAFTVEGPGTQHVAYRGPSNHIYEVIW